MNQAKEVQTFNGVVLGFYTVGLATLYVKKIVMTMTFPPMKGDKNETRSKT